MNTCLPLTLLPDVLFPFHVLIPSGLRPSATCSGICKGFPLTRKMAILELGGPPNSS